MEPARALVRETLARPGAAGWTALVTGEPALEADLRTLCAESTRASELRLAPLTFVVLVFAFGALVSAALPVAVAFLSICLALGVIGAVTRIHPVSIYVLNIASMLGLGVGIDYSLLMVNRFREELRAHSPELAAVRAARAAIGAIITSGATVLVGFGALLLTPIVESGDAITKLILYWPSAPLRYSPSPKAPALRWRRGYSAGGPRGPRPSWPR